MQPTFKTNNLAVYCLRDTDRKHLPIDIYFALWRSSREIVVHASLEKQPKGDCIITTIDLSREFEEGEYDDDMPAQELLLEFCRGLEDHVDTGDVLLYPRNEQSEALLKEWRPTHYALHREWQRIDPLLSHETFTEMHETYAHRSASQI